VPLLFPGVTERGEWLYDLAGSRHPRHPSGGTTSGSVLRSIGGSG